jgi:flagellar basal body-associated protein FliL
MPKTTKPELQPQPSQMPSQQMDTKKPKSHKRLWLSTGVIMVLVLIMIFVVASQASNSSQSTKTTIHTAQLSVNPAQPTHDMDHTLTVDPAQPTHDMDHVLTVGP